MLQIFAAFRAAIEQWKAEDGHVGCRMLWKVKVLGDRFGRALVILLNIDEVIAETVAYSTLPVSPIYSFLQKVQVMQ